MIAVRCVKCEAEFEVADGYAGQRIACRRCGKPMPIARQAAPSRPSNNAPGVHIPDEGAANTALIKFRCVHCVRKHGVGREYAGKVIRCSACGQPVKVPYSGSRTAMAFAEDEHGPTASAAPLELPDTSILEQRAWESRATRRVVKLALVGVVLVGGLLFAVNWVGDHTEQRRLADLEQQVTALIREADLAIADQDFRTARIRLDDAWAVIEQADIPTFRAFDLEAQVRAARAAAFDAQQQPRPRVQSAGR